MAKKRPLRDEAPESRAIGPEAEVRATDAGEDTEGQSFHNYELVRAVSRERSNEAARMARDAARAREVREAKRSGR
jgi:hypothetical protein